MIKTVHAIADAINWVLTHALMLPLLKLYRLFGSPIAYALGSRCRFYPSCSHYAEEAFHTHGFFRGFVLSTVRLAKCNPLHPGGIDPVPPKGHWKNPEEQLCDDYLTVYTHYVHQKENKTGFNHS